MSKRKFGMLEAIELIPEEHRKNKYGRREWLCKCDCGKKLILNQNYLYKGARRSELF